MRHKGTIKRKKDDLYLVGCTVTGSSEVAAADPKCSLMHLMEYGMFTEVKRLVGPGGKYEGYLQV